MNCDICSREHASTLPFTCVACARGTTYLPRLNSAKILLEKESLGKRIEDIGKDSKSTALKSSSSAQSTEHDLSEAWSAVFRDSRKTQSELRTQAIERHLIELRGDIKDAKRDIESRRAKLATLKASLESIKNCLPDRRRTNAEKIADITGKGDRNYDNLHKKISETRAFLCQEAAVLLRFKQKRRRRERTVQDQYYISGLPVVDLKDISGLKCTELSASLTCIAHLLNLASFYLGVRLPAEVTVPHHDYPLPTISTPTNSYLTRSPPFPGTSFHSAATTPSASKHGEQKAAPRPRPLFIMGDDEDDKVVHVARKDPTSFAFFLEGLALLAWDIAWLCRSQGFTAGTENWEDVCNIGRNLWQLLLAPAQSPALMRVLSSRDVQDRQKSAKNTTIPVNGKHQFSAKLGEHSHSSTHSFLGAPDAQDLFRGWKLATHTMIVDPLKKALWAEMNNAEWEVLQEREWDDGGEQFDEAVLIKVRPLDGHEFDDARSIMTARPDHGDSTGEPADGGEPGDSTKAKGTSGWTKLKSRDK